MDLIEQYITETRLVSHHIVPFDDLLVNGLQDIVNREPPVVGTKHIVKFGHICVDSPKYIHSDRTVKDSFPNIARKQNTTYEGVVSVNVHVEPIGSTADPVLHCQVPIGKMPIMVRSSACNLTRYGLDVEKEECSNDPGGYFIIKGKERVLVGQLRPAYNRVYTVETKPGDKYTFCSEMRTVNPAGNSVLIKAVINDRNYCFFSLPYIKIMLPAGIVFKALGTKLENLKAWLRLPCESAIQALIEQYDDYETSQDAIASIAASLPEERTDAAEYVKSILTNELFYHVGELTREKSAIHLAFILKRLVSVSSGLAEQDDKHNLANKRLDTSGQLVGFLFNGLFKQFTKTLSNHLKDQKTANPITVMRSLNSLHGLAACFMASNWTTQKSSCTYSREGVSQVLSVQNYGARMSYLRRIMLPNGVKGKSSTARQFDGSSFSFICPYETPEGERVGLVSNLSNTVDVTIDIPTLHISIVVEAFKSFRKDLTHKNLIIINGKIIGSCENATVFRREYEEYRSSDLIDDWVSLSWLRHYDELHILSDEGRLVRPLLLGNGIVPKSFQSGVKTGQIVFRDVLELEQAVVAMTPNDLAGCKCDYSEICPGGTMMSVMASVIPFCNHSQSPRNAYQSNMGKQAIGIPCESFMFRYDTTLHVLNYLQQPITKSKMVNVIKFNEMCHGAMPIVAIMTYCGFNQEDSIILNGSSIQRGLFVATTYKTITEEEKKRGKADFESICLPKIQYRKHNINYEYLDSQGIVRNDHRILLKVGDAIVGKTINKTVTGEDGSRTLETTDATVTIKPGEEGFVDSVINVINGEGSRIVKIRTRLQRIPEIGDKFASSTAQKGTCGMIYSQQDMPFDADGVCPDLIINPHAIPSRMTINMLIEQCFNLVGCKTGTFHDATVFEHPNIETELEAGLKSAGFTDYCSQLYSGFTGAKYPCKTFMAPAFYQRLKHMVSDKIHARMAGPLETTTHQPVSGRSRDGGLRFGTMECDATLASGASRMVKEFMFDQSDKYVLNVCQTCGQVPFTNDYCETCQDSSIVGKNTPYATKLFYQLLQGMGVKIKIE